MTSPQLNPNPKLNPNLCPLCGMPNQCAMEIAKATGQAQEPCWCVNAYFTPELLAKLPEEAKGQACICAGCAAKAAQPAQAPRSNDSMI